MRRVVVSAMMGCLPFWLAVGAAAGPVHEAARAGDSAKVRQLLDQTPGLVDTLSAEGETPLLAALAAGREEVAALLLTTTPCAYTDPALDIRTPQGERARSAGLIQKALPTVTGLVRTHPDSETINFAYGIVNLSLRDYSRAALAFERVLVMNKDNSRARLELAVSDYVQGYNDLARSEFEEVLRSNPSPDVRKAIDSYMAEINQTSQPWTWSGRLDAGAFYDDNVNVGPRSDVIDIAPITLGAQSIGSLNVTDETKPAGDVGIFAALSGSGACDVGEPRDWRVVGDVLYYENWLKDEHEDVSRFSEVSAGVDHVAPRGTLRLPATVDYVGSGGSTLVTAYGVTPSYRARCGANGEWGWDTSVRAEYRDWRTLNERDGWYAEAGETVRRYVSREGDSVGLGVSVLSDNTDSDVYSYLGFAVSAETSLRLPWESVLSARVRYRHAKYDEKEVLAPRDRRDNQWQAGVSASKMILETVGATVSYLYTRQESTFDLYDYDRNVVTAGMFYLF